MALVGLLGAFCQVASCPALSYESCAPVGLLPAQMVAPSAAWQVRFPAESLAAQIGGERDS